MNKEEVTMYRLQKMIAHFILWAMLFIFSVVSYVLAHLSNSSGVVKVLEIVFPILTTSVCLASMRADENNSNKFIEMSEKNVGGENGNNESMLDR